MTNRLSDKDISDICEDLKSHGTLQAQKLAEIQTTFLDKKVAIKDYSELKTTEEVKKLMMGVTPGLDVKHSIDEEQLTRVEKNVEDRLKIIKKGEDDENKH